MKTNTPETNAECQLVRISCDDSCCDVFVQKNGLSIDVVDADFAARLERERDHWEKRAMELSDEVVKLKENINKLTMRYENARDY